MQWLRKKGWLGKDRLHLCAGSVKDGTTCDINPATHPTVLCDLELGIPFKDNSFDTIIIDPPYATEKAMDLYGVPLISVPKLLSWKAIWAIYVANRGPKPLRACQVWVKKSRPLEGYGQEVTLIDSATTESDNPES
jgi:hypothetical protein